MPNTVTTILTAKHNYVWQCSDAGVYGVHSVCLYVCVVVCVCSVLCVHGMHKEGFWGVGTVGEFSIEPDPNKCKHSKQSSSPSPPPLTQALVTYRLCLFAKGLHLMLQLGGPLCVRLGRNSSQTDFCGCCHTTLQDSIRVLPERVHLRRRRG